MQILDKASRCEGAGPSEGGSVKCGWNIDKVSDRNDNEVNNLKRAQKI